MATNLLSVWSLTSPKAYSVTQRSLGDAQHREAVDQNHNSFCQTVTHQFPLLSQAHQSIVGSSLSITVKNFGLLA